MTDQPKCPTCGMLALGDSVRGPCLDPWHDQPSTQEKCPACRGTGPLGKSRVPHCPTCDQHWVWLGESCAWHGHCQDGAHR